MRRQGIEVIGIFLADEDELQEREIETMHAIYGHQSLIIPSIPDIPALLQPLLKKLLIKYL
jgi:nitric oxide reductase activation protein